MNGARLKSVSDDPTGDLYKALAHPLRRAILAYLIEKNTGSPSEMSKVIEASLPDISHHVRQLVKYGAAELVDTRVTKRGSDERIYRPTARVLLDSDEVEHMSATDRQIFAGQCIQKTMDDLRKGFQVGAFAKDARWALLHNVLDLDEAGLNDLIALSERVQQEMLDLQAESVQRRADSGAHLLRVSANHLCFITNL